MLACHAGGRGFESRPLRQLSKRAPETVPSFFGSSSIHGAHDESLAQVPAGRRVLAAGSRFSLRRTSPAFAGAGSVLSRARALHSALVAAPARQARAPADTRTDEPHVGQEGVSNFRSLLLPDPLKTKTNNNT